MKINCTEVRDGKHDGKIVWICDYRRPDLHKKPLRCVKPTRVLIRANDELPSNKKVYYSNSHFSPLKADGTPYAKVISPVDNTGYRSLCGNMLYVFDNKEECVNMWNTLVGTCIQKIQVHIDYSTQLLVDDMANLAEMMEDAQ